MLRIEYRLAGVVLRTCRLSRWPATARAGLTDLLAVAALAGVAACACCAGEPDGAEKPGLAATIAQAWGRAGGLVVVLGAGDGELIAGLAEQGGFLVHGLAWSPDEEQRARKRIQAGKHYGKASVCEGRLPGLPYAGGIVNILIANDAPALLARGLRMDEIMRVVAPGGRIWLGAPTGQQPADLQKRMIEAGLPDVALTGGHGVWVTGSRPAPRGMDEWTHYRHDPARTATSRDELVAPADELRWMDGPSRFRGHYDPPAGVVSAGGRLYVAYDAATPSYDIPAHPAIMARDAFSGVKLWEKRIEAEAWDKLTSRANQRVIVAHGDKLFSPLRLNGPLAAIDGATGRILHEYAGTRPGEVAYFDGNLLVAEPQQVRLIDEATGAEKWKYAFGDGQAATVVADGRVFVHVTVLQKHMSLACLDLATGAVRWKRTFDDWTGQDLVPAGHAGGMLIMSGYGFVAGVQAGDGEKKWQYAYRAVSSGAPMNVFFPDGKVWIHGGRLDSSNQDAWLALNPADGKLEKEVPASFHEKCALSTSTGRYLISGRMTFTDWNSGKTTGNPPTRGACHFGVIPANGMIYSFPTDCLCYPHLKGMAGLASAREAPPEYAGGRLVNGEAYGIKPGPPAGPSDWPAYRRDAARSAGTESGLPPGLRELWRAPVGTRPTAPAIACGRVYVASADEHGLYAFDAQSGRKLWSYTTGARISHPPAYHSGLLLLGCQDGQVYCLSADAGKLVWRYMAAPFDRRIFAYGQLEAQAPVQGGVLVDEGRVYAVAGRHTSLRGGIAVHALDVASGKALWNTPIAGTTVADMLVKGGEHLYMRQLRMQPGTGAQVLKDPGDGLVLRAGLASTLLDDVFTFRTYWTNQKASGALLAFDRLRTVGVTIFGDSTAGKRAVTVPGQENHRVFMRAHGREGTNWTTAVPVRPRALVLAGAAVAVAGPLDRQPFSTGQLLLLSASDGSRQQALDLDSTPVFDGMAVAGGRLYLCCGDGTIRCLAADASIKNQ